MNELIDTNPDINVRESEYKRLLGYPIDYELSGRAKELAEWARQWYMGNGKPWVYAVKTDELDIQNGRFRINGVKFTSKKLRDQLAKGKVHSAFIAAISAGKECEVKSHQLWQEGKPDEYFFLEIFGSAVVEHLVTNTGARFCAWADEQNLAILPHYSPGYAGWDVSEQAKLNELIFQKKINHLSGKLEVLETGMLNPKKSLLALFGISPDLNKIKNLSELIPCNTCSLLSCQYRRATYKHPRKQIEDVSKLQPENYSNEVEGVLYQNARYNFGVKVLEKWSQQRLKLQFWDDSSIKATFEYEGTTCSNLGHPLKFDYHIKLGPATDNYKIISLSCVASDGDEGYSYMCEYLENPESLMAAIENEKPLLGQPLNEVLNWKREFTPDGCYCKSNGRDYKWGVVLEVLHYALAQYEIQKTDNKFVEQLK